MPCCCAFHPRRPNLVAHDGQPLPRGTRRLCTREAHSMHELELQLSSSARYIASPSSPLLCAPRCSGQSEQSSGPRNNLAHCSGLVMLVHDCAQQVWAVTGCWNALNTHYKFLAGAKQNKQMDCGSTLLLQCTFGPPGVTCRACPCLVLAWLVRWSSSPPDTTECTESAVDTACGSLFACTAAAGRALGRRRRPTQPKPGPVHRSAPGT